MIKCKDDVEQQLLLDGDQQQLQQQRGLKTIVDKDWQRVEKQNNIQPQYDYFPISYRRKDTEFILYNGWQCARLTRTYNLRNVSLISLLAELGIELRQFDEEISWRIAEYIFRWI
jgi:hypothetical protein